MCLQAVAQVWPADGAVLNYRVVGFELSGKEKQKGGILELASGYDSTERSFLKKRIKTVPFKDGKAIVELPAFGQRYTWRIAHEKIGHVKFYGPLYHFSTGFSDAIDTARQRLRVVIPARGNSDGFVFTDGSRALYDLNGKPIWFLPDLPEFKGAVNDLKFSPFGTITFLVNKEAYEIDYNGRILWKAPDTTHPNTTLIGKYHHEFSRLANGNYMVLSTDVASVFKKWPSNKRRDSLIADTSEHIMSNDTSYLRSEFGTIKEYDKNDKLIWCWNSLNYFRASDICYRYADSTLDFNMHENAFYFDDKQKVVYASFKYCSRILKISYPDGKVIAEYGEQFGPGNPDRKKGLFYGQHSARRSHDGYLYLFNNNIRDSTGLPQVLMLKEPAAGRGPLTKVWEYDCTMDDIEPPKQNRLSFQTGGNVMELPDGDFFVCMPGQDSRLLIVDRAKNVRWAAVAEKWDADSKTWKIISNYRGSAISRNDLTRLVWRH